MSGSRLCFGRVGALPGSLFSAFYDLGVNRLQHLQLKEATVKSYDSKNHRIDRIIRMC